MTTETNAERLQRIRRHESSVNFLLGGTTLRGDWDWLIQQADRAQELEGYVIDLVGVEKLHQEGKYEVEFTKVWKENVRLREALGEIATETGTPYAQIAKAALKGKSE